MVYAASIVLTLKQLNTLNKYLNSDEIFIANEKEAEQFNQVAKVVKYEFDRWKDTEEFKNDNKE